ncbi:MAG: hypothetical protein KDD50_03525 [Bdellovibrionales bacterium]|nr:hypothetical protein [Bdellovibrionales bacterium]
MKKDLTRKLNVEIDLGITKETQVVYLLAGIRKILEQSEDSMNFGHLKFYCDWVLHSRLTGPPARKVVQILEDIYKCMKKNERVPDQTDAMLLIQFELLKQELSAFLQKFDLKDFTQSTNAWVVFIYLYSRVVQDCPLEMPSNVPFDIKKIVVRLETAKDLIDDHLPYKVNWNFEAKVDLPPAQYYILNSYSVAEIGRL